MVEGETGGDRSQPRPCAGDVQLTHVGERAEQGLLRHVLSQGTVSGQPGAECHEPGERSPVEGLEGVIPDGLHQGRRGPAALNRRLH